MARLTVTDLFCGAGGFSEGFRQQGCKILHGIDSWEPAIKTFNHNFSLKCKPRNILALRDDVKEIYGLPDTDIIIGSPPCVTFSSSNTSLNADRSSGKDLTRIFLRIVAVKKWQHGSILKAWFMENVPASMKSLNKHYTFERLGLSEWAVEIGLDPLMIAVSLDDGAVINASDYGSVQNRKRVISGEMINKGKLVVPIPTHTELRSGNDERWSWRFLREIRNGLPSPFSKKRKSNVTDPNYANLSIRLDQVTDHFYDSGLFDCEWRQSRYAKVNHPYMGKMAFPENQEKPSRTVTATKIGTARETLIYQSEFIRSGNGEYRTPTVREAACLMGFPITFQFIGPEATKWRLVGNAVCPAVAAAFAKQVLIEYGLKPKSKKIISSVVKLKGVNNLNTFSLRSFEEYPKRIKGSRFRRHPFKDGNITVTLSNYDVNKNERNSGKWRTSVQYGNGEGFPTFKIRDHFYEDIESVIQGTKKGGEFLAIINNGFTEAIGKRTQLQKMYEAKRSEGNLLEPTRLVEKISMIIDELQVGDDVFDQKDWVVFRDKDSVPLKQLFALYAVNKISSIANS